jgi:hypothetical protein
MPTWLHAALELTCSHGAALLYSTKSKQTNKKGFQIFPFQALDWKKLFEDHKSVDYPTMSENRLVPDLWPSLTTTYLYYNLSQMYLK